MAGSRDIIDYRTVGLVIMHSGFAELITEIVSGTARGVDQLGEKWAQECNIPIKRFKPDWNIGKKAGPLRNIDMGNYADALIALRLDDSRGTTHMIETMIGLKKPVYYCDFRQSNTDIRPEEPILIRDKRVNYEIELVDGKRRYIGGVQEHRSIPNNPESATNV